MLTHDGRPIEIRDLCEVSRAATHTTGAGIMLLSADLVRASIGTTNETSALLEQLQYSSGNGPCVDAYADDFPVMVDDLEHSDPSRWFGFRAEAIDAGARAVFGFPLRIGNAGLGALNLYRDAAGALTDEQHADAVLMAEIAAQVILAMKVNTSVDQLAAELSSGTRLLDEVLQATGMISVPLRVSLIEAMTRLRGEAFSSGLPLREFATSVVQRKFRFHRDEVPGSPA
jgi:hypothetical protein